MHLNQLYGYFGRKQELLETLNVKNSDLPSIIKTKVVKTIIEINDEISTVLIIKNLDFDVLNELKTNQLTNDNTLIIKQNEVKFKSEYSNVKSNVAIASAVTAYARIHMIKFKVLALQGKFNIYYTDTDSIFIDQPLPES